MYFKYTCQHCGKSLKINEEHAGRKARCPYCHNTVTVPAAPKAEESSPPLDLGSVDAASMEGGRSARSSSVPTSAPVPPRSKGLAAPPASPAAAAKATEPAKPQPETPVKTSPQRSQGASKIVGTDVNMMWTAVIAMVITAMFYGGILVMFPAPRAAPSPAPAVAPAAETAATGAASPSPTSPADAASAPQSQLQRARPYFAQLFVERGWVPYVETYLFWWAVVILIAKIRRIRSQRDSMLFDLLPTELGESISPGNVDVFIKNVRELPTDAADSFLINRVARGLEHFRIRKNNAEVAAMMQSQSDLDANAVGGSYTMIRFCIWAIPILGFIGTVIGIGQAVGGFSGALDAAQDMSKLKDSLKVVTSGLSTAFDTTLVALVMAFIIKFTSDPMQKREDGLLNWVDEYCNENLLKRLNDIGTIDAGMAESAQQIRKAVDAAFIPHEAEIMAWSKKLEAIGSSLSDRVSQGWEKIHADMQQKHGEHLDVISKAITSIAAKQATNLQQINSVQESLASLQSDQVSRLQEVGQALGTQADMVTQRAQEHQQTVTELTRQFQEQMVQQAQHLQEQLQQMLEAQQASLQAQGQQSVEQMTAQIGQQAQQAQELAQQQLEQMQAQMQQTMDAMAQQAAQQRQDAQEQLGQLTEVVRTTMEAVNQGAAGGQQQIADAMSQSADAIRGYFAGLEKGLASLNGVLEKLGQQQVVIEAHIEQPRRGWLFGGKR